MAFKMKGSPMRRNFGVGSSMKQSQKSWEADFTQTELERERDRGENRNPDQDRRNFYNEKKARRRAERSEKADAKARAAMAEYDAIAPTTQEEQDALSKKEARKVARAGRKAARKSEKANVKEALAQRSLRQKGSEGTRPEAVTRVGKGLDIDVELPGRSNVAKGQRKFGTKAAGNTGRRKGRHSQGGVSVEVVDKERRDNERTHQARKAYRQSTGLRGDINTRRRAKGKDAI